MVIYLHLIAWFAKLKTNTEFKNHTFIFKIIIKKKNSSIFLTDTRMLITFIHEIAINHCAGELNTQKASLHTFNMYTLVKCLT